MPNERIQNNRRQQRIRRQHRSAWPVALFLFMIAALAAWYGLTRPLTHDHQTALGKPILAHPRVPLVPGRTNILFIGTDTRPGDPNGNSDVLVLCSIDEINKRIEMMSVPRDTKVTFPDGHRGKINEGLQVGGPSMVATLVSNLLDQPVNHYALTHFGGLVNIINTMGGVTVNVPERMYYVTGDRQYNVINLHKGLHTLTGEQALGFVRFRHDALGDIGRTERQQVFLSAMANQLLQPDNLPKLPSLVRQVWATVETDMNLIDVMGLSTRATQFKGYPILHETLPGSFHDPDPMVPGDQSYWIVNPNQARYATRVLFNDGVVQKNPIQDPSVTDHWLPPTVQTGNETSNPSSNVTNNPLEPGRPPQS